MNLSFQQDVENHCLYESDLLILDLNILSKTVDQAGF